MGGRLRPEFLVLSPAKTGSTWLAANLRCHPGIHIPAIKEINFFSYFHKHLGLDWYRRLFRNGAALKNGDVSPCYALLPQVTIRQIHGLFPDLKLIFILREPVARAWSHARHCFVYQEANFQGHAGPLADVPEAMWRENFAHPWPRAHGDYQSQLRRWLSVFPKEQMHVEFFDSIAADPEALLRRILAFLGLSADVDFSRYPLFKKIQEGPPLPLPETLRTLLQETHAEPTRKLAGYLRDTLRLTCPDAWRVTPESPDDSPCADEALAVLLDANPPPWGVLLEEGFAGFNILFHHGRFVGLSQHIGPVDLNALSPEDVRRMEQCDEIVTATTLAELRKRLRPAARKAAVRRVLRKCGLARLARFFFK
jgi:hypothetical protein